MFTREQAIQDILLMNGENAIYIFSLGYISRTAYKLCEGKYHAFYMLGSMGLTRAIAQGMADFTKRNIVVVRGDGDFLMNDKDPNHYSPDIEEYILSNNMYESTGGQKCIPIKGHYDIEPSPPDPRVPKDPKEIARDIIHCLAGKR